MIMLLPVEKREEVLLCCNNNNIIDGRAVLLPRGSDEG